MRHRPPTRRQPTPDAGHEYDNDYVPFDSITVHERDKTGRPLLYDQNGKPLVHTSDLPRKIGFKPR